MSSDPCDPANSPNPDVLQMRWRVFAKSEKWDTCLEIATALIRVTPDRPIGWIHQAVSLDKLGRTADAKEVPLGAVKTIGPSSICAFHIACFCAQLGQFAEAQEWVRKTIEWAEDKEAQQRLRLRVLDEPVLEPFSKDLGA
jgi:hypothetical protein